MHREVFGSVPDHHKELYVLKVSKIRENMISVFISHSWHDKKLARKIAITLESFGIRVWLDEAEIKIGDSLITKIRKAIDDVDYVVALVSENSVTSEWVKKELDIAMTQEIEGQRIKVLPILAGPCSLPGFLKGKLYADMSNSKAFRESLPMLLDRLSVNTTRLSKGELDKSLEDMTKEKDHIRHIIDKLSSDDPMTLYHALEKIDEYEDKLLYDSADFLNAVVSAMPIEFPTSV